MHAVREVDVGVAADEIHRLVARRSQAAARVTGLIVRTEVCLTFDEARGEKLSPAATPQNAAEECASDGDGVVEIKLARQLLRHRASCSSVT